MGFRAFEVEQRAELCAFLPLENGLVRAAEFFQVFLRQIDAALGCVCSDVPKDVCKLKRHSEGDGIVLCPGRCRSEDMEADQTHD